MLIRPSSKTHAVDVIDANRLQNILFESAGKLLTANQIIAFLLTEIIFIFKCISEKNICSFLSFTKKKEI